jgi:hypothetical protein
MDLTDKTISDLHQSLPSSIDKIARGMFTGISLARYHTSTRHKGINPLKVYYTSPSLINEWLSPVYNFRIRHAGKVIGGEWDRDSRRFDSYVIYTSLVERFEKGYRWEETALYSEYTKKVRDGETWWHGCSSVEDIRDRCDFLDDLYESIKDDGYRLQSELDGPQARKTRVYPYAQREISVNVGRNGQLILLDGRHRLAIAKIVGIDEVPIHIAVVHEKWRGGLPEGVYEK